MSFRNVEQIQPFLEEGYKLLRDKFKFGAQESKRIVQDVWISFAMKRGADDLPNPRRAFLHALRGWAARLRREERAWANGLKRKD